MSSIMVGSARSDERGKLTGGEAGDQKQKSKNDTSGEISQQTMYTHSKGWYILRPKSSIHASEIANAMIVACDNKNIGYDQNNRLGIIKYGVNSKVKTEADCSSTVRACIIQATGKDVGNFTTANEKSVLESSGLFNKAIAYVSQSKTPVFNGDVLVTKTKGHTVIVTSGNPRTTSAKYYTKYTGSSSSLVEALASVGEKDTSFTHRQLIANKNGVTSYTGSAVQNCTLLALLKKGLLLVP